jgi:hypothetical protein
VGPDRRQADNTSALLSGHVPRRRLKTEKGSLEVNVQHSIPVGFVNFQQGTPLAKAGAIDEDIDAAVALDALLEESLNLSDPRNIGRYGAGLVISLLQPRRHLPRPRRNGIVDYDRSAGLGKPLGQPLADSSAASGNQDDTVAEGGRL